MNNISPAPVFPTCTEVKELAKPGIHPSLYRGKVRDVNIMLKLREEQPLDERESFGECRATDVFSTGRTN